jgi:hypothetical protein
MKSTEIRRRFIDFFVERDHAVKVWHGSAEARRVLQGGSGGSMG